MSELELTDVTGIGPSFAENFRDNGFTTVEDIAEASAESLSIVDNVSASRAEDIRANAREAIEAHREQTDDSDSDTTAEADSESEAETDDAIVTPDTASVTLDCDRSIAHTVVWAVLEEELRMRQRNQLGDSKTMASIADTFMQDVESADGDEVTLTAELNRDACDLVHQALGSALNDLQSRQGINWGPFADVQSQLDEYRTALRS